MPKKFGVIFLGMMMGGATFLVAGSAIYVTTSVIQYRTIQARAMQATEQQYAQFPQAGGRLRPQQTASR
jgi:hypothetical protein